RDLFGAQASLTGESVPAENAATTRQPQHSNPLQSDTLCLMGTIVVSAAAQAMAFTTGTKTALGPQAGRVNAASSGPYAFPKG
ncbi:hypothetical protein, partial [Escherichia coli]|uniref:hypothetical protein n=1 Tax=Escherichia coli TaxID=562 RepID=UPI0015C5663A